MLVAAALCPAPPLLARELTGADPVVPELRRACLEVVTGMLGSRPDLVVVAAVADRARQWDPAGRLDLSAFAPALGRGDRIAAGAPVPLGLAGLLLDQAGYDGPRELHSVTEADAGADCAVLGARLAALRPRVGLLVMADGSARRTLKAPGYLDERSAPFDDAVIRAIGSGDLAALLDLDPALARDLMATGRPAWQVLAGAAGSLRAATEIRYLDDPFGVLYLAASVACGTAPHVELRLVQDSDLDAIFEQLRDPESVQMAAFTADDPDDRPAFEAHMARVLSSPDIIHRAVTCDGQLAGHIAAFPLEGNTEVTYWIDRAWWGRGVASQALTLLLELVSIRPLHARTASDNLASLRVLRKAGFEVTGTEISFASARQREIEETILRKD